MIQPAFANWSVVFDLNFWMFLPRLSCAFSTSFVDIRHCPYRAYRLFLPIDEHQNQHHRLGILPSIINDVRWKPDERFRSLRRTPGYTSPFAFSEKREKYFAFRVTMYRYSLLSNSLFTVSLRAQNHTAREGRRVAFGNFENSDIPKISCCWCCLPYPSATHSYFVRGDKFRNHIVTCISRRPCFRIFEL